MRVVPLKNKDEIFEQVLMQLRRYMMSDKHTIEWLEDESKNGSEYPIKELAAQTGFRSTGEFLYNEFNGYIEFVGRDLIRAGSKLYDNEALGHIVDLHARTVPKNKNIRGGNYGGRGGGKAGTSSNYYPSNGYQAPSYQSQRRPQQPSNYSSTTDFQPQRRPSPPRKHSPPTPPNATLTDRRPSSTANFSVHPSSSSHRLSPTTLIAGPPPGFEKLLHQETDIDSNKQSCNNEGTATAGSVKPSISGSSSDDDPYKVKTAKTLLSRKGSSPDHRPPPDPKNARFEESENENRFLSSPPGYRNPSSTTASACVKPHDPYGFDSSDDEEDGEEEFFDALEEQPIKLPPQLSFKNSEKRQYEPVLQYPQQITPALNEAVEVDQGFADDSVDNYLDYFVNIITAIHYNIPNKSKALFFEVVKNLPEKVCHQPGFDPLSLLSIIKVLGSAFIDFTEEFNVENGMSLIYVKSVNRGMKKDEYRKLLRGALSFLMPKLSLPLIVENGMKLIKAVIYEARNGSYSYFIKSSSTKAQEKKLEEMLRNIKTINLVKPYPRALCIYYRNNQPYRSQIIAQIDTSKIMIELVDIGEFLTVSINQLKTVESDILSLMPRFAIPCVIENDKTPNLRKALDGFDRKSTCKTVPMYFTQMKSNKNYVSIELF